MAQMVQNSVLSDEARLKKASAILGIPFVRLSGRTIRPEVINRIPEEVARRQRIIAYEETTLPSGRKMLRLAVTDPKMLESEAPQIITDLHLKSGMIIEVALTTEKELILAMDGYKVQKDNLPKNIEQSVQKPTSSKSDSGADQEIPKIDLTNRTIPKDVLERIPGETARKYRVTVFDVQNNGQTIHIATENPDNMQVRELLSFIRDRNHLEIKLYLANAESIDSALSQYELTKTAAKPIMESDIKEEDDKDSEMLHIKPGRPAFVKPEPKNEKKLENTDIEPKPPQLKPVIAPVVQVKLEELKMPDLHVPKEETVSLIPLSTDVEHDLLGLVGQEIKSIEQLEIIVKTGFIPKIVGAIVLLAGHLGASDIHIQATDLDLVVRLRVDGILQDIIKMPVSLQPPIISRIKILAKLKIDEQRVPQDGRFEVEIGKRKIDLRISTLPTIKGEKIAIRLLDKSVGMLKFEELGLVGSALARLKTEIGKPYGVILATGPTGSGKSTTLYAILQEIAGPKVNVITLEDPVEYEIAGINQVQIRPKIGFSFAEGLRSILRQDPNIIMVGEVRDLETASLMTHAALTGHLVLSTLHTNDSSGALPRLINMGVEPFLITSAMNGVIAQRLVRKLCAKCRVPWTPPAEVITQIKEKLSLGNHEEVTSRISEQPSLFKAKGCEECHDGFKGRIGIYEILVMTEKIEELVIKKAPASEIQLAAINEGMVSMEQDGLVKVLDGKTTLDEIWRVTKVE